MGARGGELWDLYSHVTMWTCSAGKIIGVGVVMYVTLTVLRENRKKASAGMGRVQNVIMPMYLPVLKWVLVLMLTEALFTFIGRSLLLMWGEVGADTFTSELIDSVAITFFIVLRVYVLLLFTPPYVTVYSIRNANLTIAAVMPVICVCMFMARIDAGTPTNNPLSYAAIAVELTLVIWTFGTMCGVFPCRPAGREFAGVFFLSRIVYVGIWSLNTAFHGEFGVPTEAVITEYVLIGLMAFLDYWVPLVFCNALLKDTRYWQGMPIGESTHLVVLSALGCRRGRRQFSYYDDYLTSGSSDDMTSSSARYGLVLSEQQSRETALLAEADSQVLGYGLQCLMQRHRNTIVHFSHLDVSQEMVGAGAASSVYKGTYKKTSAVAVKFFRRQMVISPENLDMFGAECEIAKRMVHPNVVKFYGMLVSPPQIGLVFELCEHGALNSFLARRDQLLAWSYEWVLKMCIGATRGIAYLHSQGIAHRDIKSLNYLVTSEFQVKLTDFGLSKQLHARVLGSEARDLGEGILVPKAVVQVADHEEHRVNVNLNTTAVGTKLWMSPEMMGGAADYDNSTDVYSLTLVLWEIYSGKLPFDGLQAENLEQMVRDHDLRPLLPADAPAEFKALLVWGWAKEKNARPSAQQLLEELQRMLLEEQQRSVGGDGHSAPTEQKLAFF